LELRDWYIIYMSNRNQGKGNQIGFNLKYKRQHLWVFILSDISQTDITEKSGCYCFLSAFILMKNRWKQAIYGNHIRSFTS
jgi:hypothetical protein